MPELAAVMGVSHTTLYKFMKISPELTAAIENGKDKAVDIVENSLFQKAVEGNPTCMIFFLKNKRPDAWRERTESRNEIKLEDINLEF